MVTVQIKIVCFQGLITLVNKDKDYSACHTTHVVSQHLPLSAKIHICEMVVAFQVMTTQFNL